MWRELRAIRAGMSGQGSDGLIAGWIEDFYAAVPAGGEEGCFCEQVPVHAEDFARVLGPARHGELVDGEVVEFYAAVAAGR